MQMRRYDCRIGAKSGKSSTPSTPRRLIITLILSEPAIAMDDQQRRHGMSGMSVIAFWQNDGILYSMLALRMQTIFKYHGDALHSLAAKR